MEKLIIEIQNKGEVKFITEIISRLGFKIETLNEKLKRFAKNTPKNVSISDTEVMDEIYAYRKKNKANSKE